MQIDYETERELGIDYETLAVKVADKVLEMEKCPYDAQVNLVLTDNEEIERVNTEFRDIARPTDGFILPYDSILRHRQDMILWRKMNLTLIWIQTNFFLEIS